MLQLMVSPAVSDMLEKGVFFQVSKKRLDAYSS